MICSGDKEIINLTIHQLHGALKRIKLMIKGIFFSICLRLNVHNSEGDYFVNLATLNLIIAILRTYLVLIIGTSLSNHFFWLLSHLQFIGPVF